MGELVARDVIANARAGQSIRSMPDTAGARAGTTSRQLLRGWSAGAPDGPSLDSTTADRTR